MSLFLAGAVVLSACGCSQDKAAVTSQEINSEISTVTEQEVSVITLPETTQVEWYEFEPHVYISKLLPDVPQDYWDSFHNLCDALRKGEDTGVGYHCDPTWSLKTDAAELQFLVLIHIQLS